MPRRIPTPIIASLAALLTGLSGCPIADLPARPDASDTTTATSTPDATAQDASSTTTGSSSPA